MRYVNQFERRDAPETRYDSAFGTFISESKQRRLLSAGFEIPFLCRLAVKILTRTRVGLSLIPQKLQI